MCTPHLGHQGPVSLTCARTLFSIHTQSLLRLCSLLTKSCPSISQGTEFPRELVNYKSVYNSLSVAYTSFRSLCSGQYVLVFCFIQFSWLCDKQSQLPYKVSPIQSKNYWRKKRLCFLNFMGTPTAPVPKHNERATLPLLCVSILTGVWISRERIPLVQGNMVQQRNWSFFFFPPDFFQKFVCIMTTTGKGSFLLFQYFSLCYCSNKRWSIFCHCWVLSPIMRNVI